MKTKVLLLLILLSQLPALAQVSAFPDSVASRLVKTAPVVFLGRPLQSELYYDEAADKTFISTAVLVLHVLRGDSVKYGTIELTEESPVPHTGVGPKHLFGNRKYVYNMDAQMYFCMPSRMPRNPYPFATSNRARVSPARVGPGLSPTIQFLTSGGAEPTRIYGLGREFASTASLYQHLSKLGRLNLPDVKFGKYQRPFTYNDGREAWIGVPTSPASSLLDPLTPEEIIQARNGILSAPFVFTGLVESSTRFEGPDGTAYVSELVQPVWIFRSGGQLQKTGLIEVVETEDAYAKGLRQNVPVVYFATESSLPANPATKSQVLMPTMRAYKGDLQAKIMIGKVGTVLGYNGLYQSFTSPQESWQYINRLPGVTPWLPPSTPAAVTSAKATK
ncbi:hypothetical protein [Hymenobacter mucosus]|uniref:Uncharacterized protein n=1 Tax=Hymenobacter mucosus TaxID=1411120 RepID=A0A239A2B6_9BACT|nr:hypothetical protein [Hymenobacter mucosus]SNR89053.1 hypothetical protein SAMN06269173_110110 [Hymenobacter mucosus]